MKKPGISTRRSGLFDDGKTLSTGHLIGLLMDGPAVILGMRGMATDAIQAGDLGQPGRLTARSTLTLTLPLPFFS